jgi:hypothetical protein
MPASAKLLNARKLACIHLHGHHRHHLAAQASSGRALDRLLPSAVRSLTRLVVSSKRFDYATRHMRSGDYLMRLALSQGEGKRWRFLAIAFIAKRIAAAAAAWPPLLFSKVHCGYSPPFHYLPIPSARCFFLPRRSLMCECELLDLRQLAGHYCHWLFIVLLTWPPAHVSFNQPHKVRTINAQAKVLSTIETTQLSRRQPFRPLDFRLATPSLLGAAGRWRRCRRRWPRQTPGSPHFCDELAPPSSDGPQLFGPDEILATLGAALGPTTHIEAI